MNYSIPTRRSYFVLTYKKKISGHLEDFAISVHQRVKIKESENRHISRSCLRVEKAVECEYDTHDLFAMMFDCIKYFIIWFGRAASLSVVKLAKIFAWKCKSNW